MNASTILIAAAALGVDVGWQPLSDGGVEYIIQIEPQLLDKNRDDRVFTSAVPVGLDVRQYRVIVGTGALPRKLPDVPAPDDPDDSSDHSAQAVRNDAVGHFYPSLPPELVKQIGPVSASPEVDTAVVTPPPSDATFSHRVDDTKTAEDPFEAALSHAIHNDRSKAKSGDAENGADEGPSPQSFVPDPDSQQVLHETTNPPSDSPSARAADKPIAAESAIVTAATAKPWHALLLTALGLGASLGANVYLGWVAWGARSRYRALLRQYRTALAPA